MAKRTSKASKTGKAGKKPFAFKLVPRTTEAALLERYPHAVKGSLRFETTGPHAGKQTMEIRCQFPGCKATRQVATSDLWQVRFCLDHKKGKGKGGKRAKAGKVVKAAKATKAAPVKRVQIKLSRHTGLGQAAAIRPMGVE